MANVQQIVRDYLLRARSEGVAQVESEARRLGQATDSLAVKTENVSRSQVSAEKALERTALRMNTSYKMTSQLAQAEATLERARTQGLQGTSAYQAAQDGLAEAQRRSTTAANDNHTAFDRLGNMLTRRLIYAVIVSQAKQAIVAIINLNAELAKTADVAARIGSGGQLFQGLSFAAEIKGVQNFPDAMIAFNKQVDLARSGLGDLATLFRANGVTVKDTQDAFFRVADLVKSAASEAQKFSVLEQSGLPATREFVRLMEQGADRIRKTSDEARKLTDDQLRQAKEVDDKWNELWANFKRESKGAVVDFMTWIDKLDDRWSRFHSDTIMPIFREIQSINGKVPIIPVTRGPDLPSPDDTTHLPRITVRPTVDPARIKELLGLEQQRIGILGQMATVEQQVRSVEIGIQLARLNNVRITKDEEIALLALARAQAVGITQIRSQIDAQKIEGATLGMSAADALAYKAVWEKVYEARRQGHPLNEQQIRDLQSEADELRKLAQQNDNFKQLTDLGRSFASSMLDAAMSSKSLSEGLKQSLDSLAKMAANAALKNLLEGNFTMAAIDTAVAVASKVASGFLDDTEAKKLEEAKKHFHEMAQDITRFNAAAAGFNLSPLIEDMFSLTASFVKLGTAAMEAHDFGKLDQIHTTFQHGLDRIVQSYLGLTASLSESGKSMAQAKVDAEGMKDAILDAGGSMAIAADISQRGLLAAMNRIKEALASTLQADIFNATGKGFINDIQGLVTQRNQLLAEGNADPALIQAHFAAMAQKIIDDAGLIGDQFNELTQRFPDLSGAVTESKAALEEQAKAAKDTADQQIEAAKRFQESLDQAARGIVDYVNNLRAGPESSLSPAARLALAQSTYNATLGLAQANNVDALGRVTSDFENLRKAAQSFYGSSAGYQNILNTGIAQLLALPAVQTSTDPVVQALLDVQQKIDTTNTNTGNTNNSLNASGQSAAQLMVTSVQKLTSSATDLGTAVNKLGDVIAALTTGTGWLNSLNILQTTASAQLILLNQQLAGSQGVITTPPLGAGAAGAPSQFSGDLPGTANNTLLLGINKIVYNTAATAENTKVTAARINNAGNAGTYSGKLAAGGTIMPNSLAIFGEHHPQGPFFARAGGSPISITPSMPSSFGGANDNSRVEAKLDQLIRVLSAVGAAMINAEAMTGREVRDAVVGAISDQTETIKAEARQSRNNPKAA